MPNPFKPGKKPFTEPERPVDAEFVALGGSRYVVGQQEVTPYNLKLSTIDAYVSTGQRQKLYLRSGHELDVFDLKLESLQAELRAAGHAGYVLVGNTLLADTIASKAWILPESVEGFTQSTREMERAGAVTDTHVYLRGGQTIVLDRLTADDFRQQLRGEPLDGSRIERILLTPSDSRVQVGSTQQLVCQGWTRANDHLQLTTGVLWTSSFPRVAEVVNGKVTAVAEGFTTIKAHYGAFVDSCNVVVPEPPRR